MATSHSLPISSPKRTVTQLPFSPSQASTGPPSLPGINTSISGLSKHSAGSMPGSPTTLAHQRAGSAVSSRTRLPQTPTHHVPPELPIGPSASMPILQPRPTAGTTHVGGIIPSSSFFHPSRPNYAAPSPTPSLPRPSTTDSVSSVGGTPADVLRLAALGGAYQRDRISEGTDSADHSAEDVKSSTLVPSLRTASMKYSPNRPTVQTNPYGRNENAGSRMRDSFEKLFKRRFSLEGNRRSPTSPVHPGPSTAFGLQSRSAEISPVNFELNVDGTDLSPTSPGHRKHSLSPLQGSSTSLNHASFIATPPTHMNPPLSATPVLDSRTGKPMRNYQLHPSRNRFFLGGRLLTGGDSPWAFIASLIVVLSITGIWFGTTCVWWWMNESPAVAAVGAYMCLLTISSMFATAFRDPGILPRNLDPDPPYPASSSSEGSLRQPLPRDLKVRAGIVRTKFCPTCMTYRPPRSSHCKMCDNCVDGCDHHCQWVNNCVGRRNYTSFFTFLFSAVTTLVLVICTTAIHLYLLTRKYHLSFHRALGTSQGVGSAVAFCISILVIWPVMALLSYHLRLLLLNVTTIEQIRNQAHKSLVPGPAPPNPFSHGSWRRNLVYMLCRPAGQSWLDARGIATEDKREVNPGLLREDDWGAEDIEHGMDRGKGE